jgi:hypothetical protein
MATANLNIYIQLVVTQYFRGMWTGFSQVRIVISDGFL